MATIVQQLYHDYHNLMDNKGDPRTAQWLFMGGPFPTLSLCLMYVYFVKVLGPKIMKNREPFQFRKILVLYNAIQVVFSIYIFYEFLNGGWGWGYSFRCQPVDYSNSPMALRMTHAAWWYYFSKFTEFLDTIFFILQKKFSHVSLLHVIHHGTMPMSVWWGVKFTPGGHSTFFGLLNSFVHIIMYAYYMLAAMGPRVRPYLWWKKHLTTMQMVQFVAIFLHAFQLLIWECDYPKTFMWWIGGHSVMFFFLFSDFYIKSYIKKSKLAKAKAAAANGHANGVANGHTNGFAKGISNGHSNGYAKGALKNSSANGHAVSESATQLSGKESPALNTRARKAFNTDKDL